MYLWNIPLNSIKSKSIYILSSIWHLWSCEHSQAEPSWAKLSQAEPSWAKPSRTEPSQAEPSKWCKWQFARNPKPSQAEPSTKLSQAGPSQAMLSLEETSKKNMQTTKSCVFFKKGGKMLFYGGVKLSTKGKKFYPVFQGSWDRHAGRRSKTFQFLAFATAFCKKALKMQCWQLNLKNMPLP